MILLVSGTSAALTLVWASAPVAVIATAATARIAFARNNFAENNFAQDNFSSRTSIRLKLISETLAGREYDAAQMRPPNLPVASETGRGGKGKAGCHFPVAKFLASSVRCPY